jgi:transcriptional regulator with XRE-family HTH domain
MTEFVNLGNFLKQKRVEANLTQRELASTLGNMNSQFVSNWERGLCAPPSHCFQKLIDMLKINRENLVHIMLEDSRIVIEAKVYKKKAKKKSA